jgi:hypothetical protein
VRRAKRGFASTIIGVVANSTVRPRIAPWPFVYRRYGMPPPQLTFAVRTRGNSAAVSAALRQVEGSLDARVFEDVTTGEQYRDDTMEPRSTLHARRAGAEPR